MKRKKAVLTVATACIMTAAVATGCASTPKPTPTQTPIVTTAPIATVAPTATPTTEPSASPMASPEASPQASPSATGAEESPAPSQTSADAAKNIVSEVDKLSEIQKSSAVVIGDTALVGVQFAQQYAGTLTTRIKDMVAEKAKTASKDVKKVVVTADPDLLTRVRAMSTKVTDGSSATSIASEFTEIVNRIAPST